MAIFAKRDTADLRIECCKPITLRGSSKKLFSLRWLGAIQSGRRHAWFPVQILFVFQALVVASALSQTQVSAGPSRDPTALSMIEASLSAMGGKTALVGLQTVKIVGSSQHPSDNSERLLTWYVQVNGDLFELRKETIGKNGRVAFATGHGKPNFYSPNGTSHKLPDFLANSFIPYEIPGVVLARELLNVKLDTSLQTTGNESSVIIHDKSTLLTTAISRQTWHFDPTTHLPSSVDYLLPSPTNQLDNTKGSMSFASYTIFQGIAYPATIQVYEAGSLVDTIHITSLHINSSLGSALFDQN